MQLAQFSACVVVARMLCGAVVIIAAPLLVHTAATLDSAFHGHPTLLLFFVMVACPVLMNTGQACIQDQFLKWAAWGPSPVVASPASLHRSSDGDKGCAELGHLPQAALSLSADLEDGPVPTTVSRLASVQSGDSVARAAVAQRQKPPAAAAGSDRRLRPPRA